MCSVLLKNPTPVEVSLVGPDGDLSSGVIRRHALSHDVIF